MNDERNGSQKIPPLYHYTTQKGLLGIIDSRSLWFTNIFYLNDASEFKYIFKLVQDELNLKVQNALRGLIYQNEPLIIGFLKDTLKFVDLNEYVTFFVFSFSEEKDQLSQWRGYCGNEGGYCVEFDVEKILAFINTNQMFKLEKCVYEKQTQRRFIRERIEESYADLNKNEVVEVIKKIPGIRIPAIDLVKPPTATEKELKKIQKVQGFFLSELFLNAPVYKHPKFYEEHEWRLYSIFAKGFPTEFRSSKSMLIPYKEIQIVKNSKEMPFKRIIVGPTNQPELSKSAVEDLLSANSIECEVELSEIPYRD
jgi:hypothetical protein